MKETLLELLYDITNLLTEVRVIDSYTYKRIKGNFEKINIKVFMLEDQMFNIHIFSSFEEMFDHVMHESEIRNKHNTFAALKELVYTFYGKTVDGIDIKIEGDKQIDEYRDISFELIQHLEAEIALKLN